jgi:hypothetical protein
MSLTTNRLDPAEQASGVSWGAIAAGAVVAAAFSLALIALGVGLGLSAISPWGGGSGSSATTFKIGSDTLLSLRYWPPQWEDVWRRACAPSEQRCEGTLSGTLRRGRRLWLQRGPFSI